MPDEYQDSFVVSSNVENLSNDQIDSDTACSDLKCKAEQISCKLWTGIWGKLGGQSKQ